MLLNAQGQKNNLNKINFSIDTCKICKNMDNRLDSAYFELDGGFEKDTVTIIINNKIESKGVFISSESLDHAGSMTVQKTKEMIVTIKINGRFFQSFNFNKNYCSAHLNYYDKKLKLTFTNRIYEYD